MELPQSGRLAHLWAPGSRWIFSGSTKGKYTALIGSRDTRLFSE